MYAPALQRIEVNSGGGGDAGLLQHAAGELQTVVSLKRETSA